MSKKTKKANKNIEQERPVEIADILFDENGKLKPLDEIQGTISEIYSEVDKLMVNPQELICEDEIVSTPETLLEDFAFGDRNLFIYDEITPDYVSSMVLNIKYWNKIDDEAQIPKEERQPIKIYINTPGGDLNATLTIIDVIKMSKTPIYTISVGESYSGGFFIAISGHKRFGYAHSSYLFHEGSSSWESDAHKSIQHNKFYEKQLKMLKQIVLSNTKITKEQYKKHSKDDWWFSAEEAIKYGIIDKISNELI